MISRIFVGSLIFLLCLPEAFAQLATNSAAISGTVVDPQGHPVTNATVVVQNTDWSLKRSSVTGADGTFTQASLPAGTYEVQASAPGLSLNGKPQRIPLNSGARARLTLRLRISAKRENVTVTGSGPTAEGNTLPPSIDKDEPVESNVVAGLNVTYLPVRDRDLLQFGQLAAATTLDGQNGLVVDGQRPQYTRAIVDGADFTDVIRGGAAGGETALAFPQTAVRDFQVIEAGGAADIGDTDGGLIKVSTKSGTNKFRGEGFYIGRPSGLTSNDAFGHTLYNSQNQFGGSVGGPIVRNRIFYYLGGEQDYLNNPAWTQFQPQPAGTALPASLASLQTQTVGKSAPTLLFGKLDVILPRNYTLDLQTNYSRIDMSNAGYGSTRVDSAPSFGEQLEGHTTWARANLTGVYGQNVVNQALLQWSADHRDVSPFSGASQINIDGFGTLGGNASDPFSYAAHRQQLSDDLALSRGRLVLHAGADYAYAPVRMQREADLDGLFTFASLDDYLARVPTRFQQTFVTGDSLFRGTIQTFGFYATVKEQLAQKLSITAGLRWDGQWNPSDASTRVPNDLRQFQPRLGLAWSASPRTTVRASAGLYDAFSPAMLFQRAFTDSGENTVTVDSYLDPALLALVISPQLHPLSAPPSGLSTTNAQVFRIDDSFRNPRSFQTSASVEREVAKDASFSVGYLRQSTWALPLWVDTNLFAPTFDAFGLPVFPAVRPDATLGQVLTEKSAAHSSYDAMTVRFKMQLPKRSNLSANYTLARSRDDEAGFDPFSPIMTLDPFDPSLDAAPSNFDVRHTLNVSAVFNLPFGLKCNPVLLARSGAPYTPVVGVDLQNDGNDWNDRPVWNGKIADRNQFRQPAFVNLDLRFVKDFTLPGEGHHLDLFLDVFNLTHASNRNFGPMSLSEFGPGTPFAAAGMPLYAPDSTQFGGPRQVQFTARVVAF